MGWNKSERLEIPPLQISAGCTCCRRQRSKPPLAACLLQAEASCLLSATAGPRSSAPPREVSASWGHPDKDSERRNVSTAETGELKVMWPFCIHRPYLLQFAVLGGGYMQVGVGQATLHKEVSHQRRLVWRILHHDPVQLWNVEERLGQSSQFGLLHQPGQRKIKCVLHHKMQREEGSNELVGSVLQQLPRICRGDDKDGG